MNIAVAGVQQRRGPRERNHRKPATRLGQQLGHARQMLVIPLRGNELDNGVLGLFKTGSRFANNQLVDLRNISGRKMTLFALLVRRAANHAGQCRLDIQQRTCHIH